MEPFAAVVRRKEVLHVTVTHTEAGAARVELSGHLRADGADAVGRLVRALGRRRVVVDLTDADAQPDGLAVLRALADDGVEIDLRRAC
jgi:hypothetical protein